LIDNQTVNNSAIQEVTTINLEFIHKAIGVFGELKSEKEDLKNTLEEVVKLANDRELLNTRELLDTTLKELDKRQKQLTISQVNLTESQNNLQNDYAESLAATHTALEKAGKITIINSNNITALAHNAKIYADDLVSIKEFCKQILKLCTDHFS
jgi:predicted nuclease with TOPRIM domain